MLCQLKPRILCIDDEPAIGDLLSRWFEASGDFHVRCETDALKATDSLRVFKPDLVILDINMPGRNGLEIARQLRDEPWLRHRPILFYSGATDMEEAAFRAGREGPMDFVKKGAGMEVIEEKARRLAAERLQLYAAFKTTCAGGEARQLVPVCG